MKKKRSFCIFLAILTFLIGCKEEVQNTYSNYPANFVCKNIFTIPQLNAAMNNLGVFTTIRYDRDRFLFTDADNQTTPVNATAIAGNSTIQMGLSGFIVGLPAIPELGNEVSMPVCYDLACPNCYSTYNITRNLKLKEGGYSFCTSCNRTYDLNNQGLVCSGDEGIRMFRYRIVYSGNTVAINNH